MRIPLAAVLLVAPACRDGEPGGARETAQAARDDASQPDSDSDAAGPRTDGDPADASAGPRYPATTDGLRQLMGDILRAAKRGDRTEAYALADSLRIPDPGQYFAAVFGPGLGGQLASDYGETAARIRELVPLLRELESQGKNQLLVDAFDRPSERAAGYQSRALERMRQRTPLYSVRFVADGEQRGFHLWSFVHDGDGFRWAGKMRGVASDGAGRAAALDLPEDAQLPLDGGVPDLLELPGAADVTGGE